MTIAHVEYLAHHWIVLAVPAFLPAVIVVAVILYIALRDRRSGETDTSDGKPGDPAEISEISDDTRD